MKLLRQSELTILTYVLVISENIKINFPKSDQTFSLER